MNRYSFYDIEQWLLKKGLLRIKGVESTDLDLYHFIKKFLSNSSWNSHTTYAKSGKSQVTGFRRSSGDTFRVCRSYFPTVSLVEVYNVILRLVQEKRIHSSICNVVHKRIYYSSTYDGNVSHYNRFDGASTDEFGVDFTTLPNSTIRSSSYDEASLNHYKITK